jgi:pyruvate,water dikinase
MIAVANLAGLPFAPPGPGTWVLETSHFTRPATRFHAEIFAEQFRRGFGESLRRYGSLLDHLDWAFVNGFPYYCPRPVGAPPDALSHPPRDVWDELAGSHPDIRKRLQTSATVFERRLWREDLDRWDREVKPTAVREHRALLSIDPTTLNTADLLAYLDRCRENQKRCAYLHHLFNVPAFMPVGDLLVHCQEWTGRSAAEIRWRRASVAEFGAGARGAPGVTAAPAGRGGRRGDRLRRHRRLAPGQR